MKVWKHMKLMPFVVCAIVLNAFSIDAGTIVVSAKAGEDIQRAIDKLPAEGGEVRIRAKQPIIVSQSIVIAKDNVTLGGEGTTLQLADGANAPVIVIGQDTAVPTVTNKNIHVRDLTIDGNRTNQSSETNAVKGWLRNNGISIRTVASCSVERVKISRCRSGGLVTELGCRKLVVRNLESFDNHFDGLAGYQTEDSLFTDLHLHDNLAAGFSFDIDFNNNIASDTIISNNGRVGIFMRDSRDNVFHGMQVRNSGQLAANEPGIFLAQVEGDATTPAAGNTFSAIMVSGSSGAGIRVNDATCINNLAVGCQFVGNTGDCVSEAVGGLLQQFGNICR